MPTSPAPNAAAPPGMCPGIVVKGGGAGSGGGSGGGDGSGDGSGGDGSGDGSDASGDGKNGGEGCGDPVCPITGRMFLDLYDFGFTGPLALRWIRSYSSRTSHESGELGFGWSFAYGWRVVERRRRVVVIDASAKEQIFADVPADGTWAENALGWSLRCEQQGYRLRFDDGTEHVFAHRIGVEVRLTAVIDRKGNTIQLDRGEHGELTGLVDSAGRLYRVRCDSLGRICRVDVATEGNAGGTMLVARYDYDERGNLARFVDAEGYEFCYRYDGHLLVEHQTPGGLSYYYCYDGRGRDAYCVETWGNYRGGPDPALAVQPPPPPAKGPDRRTFKGINHVRFEYDKEGSYTEVCDSLGGVTRYFGDANGRVLKEIDPAGGVTERQYDPVSGALIAESRPTGDVRQMLREGLVSRYWQDTTGASPSVFVDDAGYEVTFDPDTGFWLRTLVDERGNVSLVQHSDGTAETYQTDDRGLLIRSTSRNGAATSFEHDGMGNCVRAEYQGSGAERFEYDYLGRRVAHVDLFGRRTEWTYDRRGDVVARRNPDGTTIRVERDWYRRPVLIEDRGRTYRYAYGGIGWLHRYEEPGGRVTEYRYDAEGDLVSVTNARGQTHTQRFDQAGRIVACETFEGLVHEVEYDAASRATRVIRPDGDDTREYDGQSRLVGAELSDGEVVTVERDRTIGTIAFTNAHVRSELAHDSMGQILRDRQGRHETRIAWQGGGLMAMVSDLGLPIVYTRQESGHVGEITAGSTCVGLNRIVGRAMISLWGNHLVLVRRYGMSGELRSVTLIRRGLEDPRTLEELAATGPDGALHHVEYSYDQRVLLVSEQDHKGRAVSYDLDAAGQVRERRVSQHGAQISVERVAYDPAGTPLADGATYDGLVRPASIHGEALEYDTAGRLRRRKTDLGDWQYEYNGLGDLVRVIAPDHEVELTYDGKSRRMRKCVYRSRELVRDVHYVWSNNVVLHEYDAMSGSARTYLREDGEWEPFGHIDVSAGEERATFYLPHPSGAVHAAVDEDGRPVWEAEISVFGQAERKLTKVDVSARFPNQFYDADVELVYNFRRWYEPRLGLFVSPDPLLLEGTINPRDYVPNPLSDIDPTGLYFPQQPSEVPTQQDGGGVGGGQHPRNASAANGQPRPGRPTQNDLRDERGTYLLTPGAYATNGTHNSRGQWVPGYGTAPPGSSFDPANRRATFPRQLQQQVDNAGYTHGCHSCGSTDPGGTSGHFVPDHQPSVSQQGAARDRPNPIPPQNVRFYPHCQRCSKNQANQQWTASRNQATNAAIGQQTAARNAAVHRYNQAYQTQAQMDAISSHVVGPGYSSNRASSVPSPQNPGDNRYLGGQSYSNWR